ncbi:MAG: hypothetical protein QM758_08395 [Armatimonas sp.]
MNQQQFESDEQRLDADAVKRVIDRAAELQRAHLETVSPDQLETLASELGISPEFVRRALNETDTTPTAATTTAPQMVTVRRKIVRKRAAMQALSAKDIRTALTPGILYSIFAGIAVLGFHPERAEISILMLMIQPAVLTIYFANHQSHRRMGALVGFSMGLLPILAGSLSDQPYRSVPGFVGFIYGPILAVLGLSVTAIKLWMQERQEPEIVEEVITEPAR